MLADMRPQLYRTALAWAGSSQADDIVQDTLARCISRLGQLRDDDAMRGWVYKIMVNVWRERLRRQRHNESFEDQYDPDQASPEHILDQNRTVQRVREAVATLKQPQREIIGLIDLQGFSYAETASILDIPIGTVMSRLNRARLQLRTTLERTPLPSDKTTQLKCIK